MEGGRRKAERGEKRKRSSQRSPFACASFPLPPSPFPLRRQAFTLLEVILALGILAASLAIIGEVTRLSHKNAELAAMEGDAILIGESVMAQLLAGLIEPVDLPPTEWLEGDEEPTWRYSLTFQPTEIEELLVARVRVEQILEGAGEPIAIELVRWVVDPQMVEDAAAESGGA